jgi:hypothetical protein
VPAAAEGAVDRRLPRAGGEKGGQLLREDGIVFGRHQSNNGIAGDRGSLRMGSHLT